MFAYIRSGRTSTAENRLRAFAFARDQRSEPAYRRLTTTFLAVSGEMEEPAVPRWGPRSWEEKDYVPIPYR
jgi:hypothetical protein